MRKKFLVLVLAIISAIACAIGVTACSKKPSDNGGNGGTTCNHSYKYSYVDINTHSGECSKCHDTVTEQHSFSNNVCSKCGYNPANQLLTVTFNANNGILNGSATQTVKLNGFLTEPAEPTRSGYTFLGWAKSKDGKSIWNFAVDVVTDDITLYAIWEEQIAEFDVTFNLLYGGLTSVVKPTENGLVTYIPTRENYDFNGWYVDSDLQQVFDGSKPVTNEGLTLYASWVEKATEVGQLSAPVISIDGNVFSWKTIEGATGYRIIVTLSGSVDSVIDELTSKTNWTFPQSLDAGVYSVKIRAVGDGITTVNSVYSSRNYSLRVLSAVTGISLDKSTSVLSWNEVENAEEYQIFIGNNLIGSQAETEIDLSNLDAGALSVRINATRENWLTSSGTANLSKMRLKTPEVIVTINENKEYLLRWDSVRYADTYILKYGEKEIEIKNTTYTIDNNSEVWNGQNTASFVVNAFDSKADYLISSGAKEVTINKLYNLNIEKSNQSAGNTFVEGSVWQPVTVSFNLNGATGSIASQTVTTTQGLNYPDVPARSGYLFRGWFTESSCENVFDFTSTVEKSITLYAGWYSTNGITFKELNSGSSSYSSSSSYRYTYFRALSGAQIRIGYSQSSSSPTSYMMIYDVTKNELWSEEQSFRNTTPGTTSFYPTAGHVYYVRTRSSSNTNINLSFTTYPSDTYLPNDGGRAKADYIINTHSNEFTNIAIYNEEYTLNASNKSGYAWLGWYNGEMVLTKELSYTFTMPSENVTYTAKWIECPVTLEKNISDAGSISGIDDSITVGEPLTITATTNAGYTWLGWYDGDVELTKEQSYTFVVQSENITYTAKWAYYTLTTEKNYDDAGTVTAYNNKKVTAGETVTLTATTNDGYNWIGWYDGETKLTEELSYTFVMPSENVTYTAKWVYYTLTTEKNYVDAGTVTTYNDEKVTVGETVTITATTNDGYNWLGWYNGEVELTKEQSYTFAMPSESVTYTAKWSYYTVSVNCAENGGTVDFVGSATVRFELNGGSGAISAQTVTNNTAITFPETIPTRSGYVFRGWYADSACTDYYDFTTPVTNDLILYAGWWNVYNGVSSSSPLSSMYIIDTVNKNNSSGNQYSFSTSTSGGRMIFFAVYKTGTYNLYYKNSSTSNGYRAAIHIYNQTQNKSYGPTSVTQISTSFRSVSIPANAGDVLMLWGEKFDSNSSTVSFYLEGNEYPDAGGRYIKDFPAKISVGETVTLQAKTNAGYTWLGWYDGENKLAEEYIYTFTMPSESVIYTAKWVKTTIESSSVDAGSVSSLTGTYKVGDRVTVTASTNAGYTWLGWYNGDTELTKELSYTFAMTAENVTYTAKWVKTTIERSSTDAGSVSSLTGTYIVGDQVTVTATTNAGYTWLGWYNGDKKLTKELSYTFAMSAENVTYTAKWIPCPVTLDKNIEEAGTISELPDTSVEGNSVTLTASTNAGYTWLGWYNGEEKLTEELSYTFAMPSEDVTYTAKWTYYTLTTSTNDVNAGSFTLKNNEKITLGETVAIIATTNKGYTWLGWFNGETELTKELSYTFAMPSENVTYTAKWIACPVILEKSISEAGTVDGLNIASKVGDEITVTATTNEGYTWLGWYNGNTKLTEELSYTFAMPSKNVTYTANWACYTLTTLTDDVNAGSVTVKNNVKITAGTTVNITATAKAGYSFDGWYNDTSKVSDDENYSFIMPDESVIYTAKWTSYTLTVNATDGGSIKGVLNSRQVVVSFDLKGGTGNIPQKIVNDTKCLTYPNTIPTKSGYVFTGWYKDASCKEIFDFSEDLSEDITLYAGWQHFDSASDGINISRIYIIDAMQYNSSKNAYMFSNESFNTNDQWAGIYFSALINGEIKIYYKVDSSADANRMRVKIVNQTQGTSEILSTDCKSTTYLSVTTNVNAGDVLRISVYSYSITNTVKFYTYVTGLKTPDDRGMVSENAFVNGNRYSAGHEKTLTAVTESGYVWLGWYKEDEFVSENLELTFTMPKENVVYTAKWQKITVDIIGNGKVTELNGKYALGEEVTLTATTYKGYTWRGWCVNDAFVSNELSYTFNISHDNLNLTAKWVSNEELSNFIFDSTEEKLTITGINDNKIARLTIPDYVDEIEYGAFADCDSLIWVSIPFVGGKANATNQNFGYIFGVTDNKKIPASIREVSITSGNSVYGFGSCTYITSVMLADSITTVSNGAFSDCCSLVKITLGSGVNSIGNYAFSSCEKLVEIINLSTLSFECGSTSFGGIAQNALFISNSIEVSRIIDHEGYLFYYDNSVCYMIGVMNNLDYMSTPDFVTIGEERITSYSIYKYAFYNNHFTKVTLSGAVTSVGDYSFFNSPISSVSFVAGSKLTELTVGRNVQSIGDYAFMWCTHLVSVTNMSPLNIQVGSTDNGYVAYYAANVYNQYSSESGTTFERDGFEFYEKGNDIYLLEYYGDAAEIIIPAFPDKENYIIHNNAFTNKANIIKSVIIPNSVTEIDSDAFYGCYNLTSVTIGNGLRKVGQQAFNEYYSFEIHYNGDIAEWCGINGLANLMVSDVTLYMNEKELTGDLVIPDGVVSIPDRAFLKCTGITSIIIPDSVTSIGSQAFFGCSKVVALTIGDGVTSIGSQAFFGCPIENATIPTIAIEHLTKSALKTLVITSGDSIPDGAFQGSITGGCDNLVSVVISDSVTSIGADAFRGCKSLQSVTIGQEVNNIGSYAFAYCSKLTNITFNGTQDQWLAITKGTRWNYSVGNSIINFTK